MTFLYWFLIWHVSGSISGLTYDWYLGEDVSIKSLLAALILGFLVPPFMLWEILLMTKRFNFWDKVLIKGRKK